ncbi:unnamed protein product [Effrenium voratum]|uniref:EF-hand domain-containing protein n=1 Tax=Effrenium voratum TaxID=2562239 RepID=A0AA36J0Y8_9DINO|nr:unnamed protein product [Effrenium voratum]CAJ1397592.1 unnamed protein product [Effrenium voratum]CAJ1441588.1 unnamed protein product [Effrenium voratum]
MAVAAAAAVGARRGRNRGQLLVVEQELSRKAKENDAKRQQNEVAQSILDKYDADKNGTLSPKELKAMLADYSLHRFKAEVRPTAEDLVFLFRLFDNGGKAGGGKADGVIDRSEILSILGAWGDFMKQKEIVQNLSSKFDKDDNHAIDEEELQVSVASLIPCDTGCDEQIARQARDHKVGHARGGCLWQRHSQ